MRITSQAYVIGRAPFIVAVPKLWFVTLGVAAPSKKKGLKDLENKYENWKLSICGLVLVIHN